MMQAADTPCRMRPAIRNVAVPDGVSAMSSEPRMLNRRPVLVSFTRPSRSARPPATTMKIPEKSAVMLTAMLLTASEICSSSRIAGATFSVVCANSQKVITARTMPRMSSLSP